MLAKNVQILITSFRIIFVTFGVFFALAQEQSASYQNVKDMFENHHLVYFLYPEYAKIVDSTLTEDKNEVFKIASKDFYACEVSEPGISESKCVEKIVEFHDIDEINDVLSLLKKLDYTIPNNFKKVLISYKKIVQFYRKLVQKLDHQSKNNKFKNMLNLFTEAEKKFIINFVSKWNNYIFFDFDIYFFIDILVFCRDNKLSQNVYEKLDVLKIGKESS